MVREVVPLDWRAGAAERGEGGDGGNGIARRCTHHVPDGVDLPAVNQQLAKLEPARPVTREEAGVWSGQSYLCQKQITV
jgi:hypothetical protein